MGKIAAGGAVLIKQSYLPKTKIIFGNQVTNTQCRQFVCLRIDIHCGGYGNIHLWIAAVEAVVEKKKSGYNKEKSEN